MQTIFPHLVASPSAETGQTIPASELGEGSLPNPASAAPGVPAQNFEAVFHVLGQMDRVPQPLANPVPQEDQAASDGADDLTPDKKMEKDVAAENSATPAEDIDDMHRVPQAVAAHIPHANDKPQSPGRRVGQIEQEKPQSPRLSAEPNIEKNPEPGSGVLPISPPTLSNTGPVVPDVTPFSQRSHPGAAGDTLAPKSQTPAMPRKDAPSQSPAPSDRAVQPVPLPSTANLSPDKGTGQPLGDMRLKNPEKVLAVPLPTSAAPNSEPSPVKVRVPLETKEQPDPKALNGSHPPKALETKASRSVFAAKTSPVAQAAPYHVQAIQQAAPVLKQRPGTETTSPPTPQPVTNEPVPPSANTADKPERTSLASKMMETAQNRAIAQPDDVTVIQQVIRLKGTGPIAPADPRVVSEQSAGSRLRTALPALKTPAMTAPQAVVDTTDPPEHRITTQQGTTLRMATTPRLPGPPSDVRATQLVRTQTRPPELPPGQMLTGITSDPDLRVRVLPITSDTQNRTPLQTAAGPQEKPSITKVPQASGDKVINDETPTTAPNTVRHPESRSLRDAVTPLSAIATPPMAPGHPDGMERLGPVTRTRSRLPIFSDRNIRDAVIPQAQSGLSSGTPTPNATKFSPALANPALFAEGASFAKAGRDKPQPGPSALQSDMLINARVEPFSPTVPHTQSAAVRMDLPTHVARQIIDAGQHLPVRPVEISLSPEELGRVRLSVTPSDAGLTVNVLAERQETLDLMRRHIHTLEQEFQALGYDGVAFSFSDGQPATDDHKQQQSDPALPDSPEPHLTQADTPPTAIRNTSSDAGLDLRI